MSQKKKILKKDIVIPAGTVFHEAPKKTVRHGEHYETVIGLTKDSSGSLVYAWEPSEESELNEWFEDVT